MTTRPVRRHTDRYVQRIDGTSLPSPCLGVATDHDRLMGKRVYPHVPVEDRFWPKVDRSAGEDACWPWKASYGSAGYGQFSPDTSHRRGPKGAHRVAYELTVGPVPEGLELDHLCRNRACCNPAHLEPVTHRENVARSPVALSAINARKTHCKRGHSLSEDNVYRVKRGWRQCKTCWQMHRRKAA